MITYAIGKFGAGTPCTLPKGSTFFGLPPWYKYLNGETDSLGKCVPSIDLTKPGTNPAEFWGVGLVVLEILIRLSAMVAVGFIIYAGFQYMTSAGSPEKAASAKSSIINAIIGLIIAVLATGVVTFIGNTLK